MSSNKLYVGNLSYSTTEEGLTELFTQAGTVTSAKIITDRATGRSKGFGFVEMSTNEEAEKAAEMFNNFEYLERNLKVNEAKPQEKKSFSGGGGGGRSRW
ncbi:MAG: RNA-binding protein [Bacteroidetes bacterium]|nr:RNA-binding protein [Bacteroidota bacterium]